MFFGFIKMWHSYKKGQHINTKIYSYDRFAIPSETSTEYKPMDDRAEDRETRKRQRKTRQDSKKYFLKTERDMEKNRDTNIDTDRHRQKTKIDRHRHNRLERGKALPKISLHQFLKPSSKHQSCHTIQNNGSLKEKMAAYALDHDNFYQTQRVDKMLEQKVKTFSGIYWKKSTLSVGYDG